MANLRIVYSNVFDDATLTTPDAYPSMPAENAQGAGRLLKTRIKPIESIISPNYSTKTIPGNTTQTAITISFWVYRTGSWSTSSLIKIGGAKYIDIRVGDAAVDEMRVGFYNGSTTTYSGAMNTTINQWHHICVTWEAGGALRQYKDGTQAGGDYDPSSDESIDGTGLYVLGTGEDYRIARVAIYARVLDTSEITALANHRYVSDDALQERWTFYSSTLGDRGSSLGGSPTYSTGPGAHATTNMTQIKGTWSSSQVVDTLAIARHNLPAAATVKLILYSDAAYGTSVYDSGTSTAYSGTRTGDYLNYAHYFSPTTARSFALEVQNSGTAWDCSRVVMGTAFAPSVNASAGHELAWRETGFQARTEGGAIISEPGEIYRSMRVSLNRVSEEERTTMSGLLYTIGANREMWLSLYPKNGNTQKEMDYSMLAIAGSPALVHPHFGNYSVSFTVEET